MLENRFPAQRRSPIIENNKIEHDKLGGNYTPFRGYDLYAGHYGYDIFAAVNDGHACITNFRHPATRLISLYNFFRFNVILPDQELRTEQYYAVRLAKSVSFEEFVFADDPRVEVYLRNWHFRQLSYSCWSLEITKQFEDVRRFVEEMPWYYVCEYPELCVRWLRRELKWDANLFPRENVTGDKEGQRVSLCTLDDHRYDMIRKKNDLDFTLYHYAVDRLLNHRYVSDRRSGWQAIFRSRLRHAARSLGANKRPS